MEATPALPCAVDALLRLKAGAGGAPSTWDAGTDPCGAADCSPGQCGWLGVECAGWRVVGLHLAAADTGQTLQGGLAPLDGMDKLAVLDLAGGCLFWVCLPPLFPGHGGGMWVESVR